MRPRKRAANGVRGWQDKADFQSVRAAFVSGCLHIVFCGVRGCQSGTPEGACGAAYGTFFFIFNAKMGAARNVRGGMLRRFYATASIFRPQYDRPLKGLAGTESRANRAVMARKDNDDFRIRPGRPRSRGTRARSRNLSFVQEVQAAIRKAGGNPNRLGRGGGSGAGQKGGTGGDSGRFNAHGRGAKALASFPRDSSGWQRDSIGRFRLRRVVVKARILKFAAQRGSRGPKMRGTVSKAADAHLRYLEHDGVTHDGEKGRAYSALENEADGRAFIERGREDRHQFRLIVAPEDSVEMEDLRGFTRDLMWRMERDLDTRLNWIAVDHHNTGHTHTHIIVRGVLDDGRILNIAGDYIAHGIRHRASELVTLELGPQTEIDLQNKLRQEVEAERLTRLDRMLIAESQERGVVDLRPDMAESYTVRANRHLLIDRAKRLERYDLTTETEPGRWTISEQAEPTLKALGERNDIIKTMHRALADHGLADERGLAQYAMHGKQITEPIIGRVLAKGPSWVTGRIW